MTVDLFDEDGEWIWRGPLTAFCKDNGANSEYAQILQDIEDTGRHVIGGGAMPIYLLKEWSPDI